MAQPLSLTDAIAATVRDGDTVAMEGFTHLIPFAAGHEVIRQGRRGLTLVRMTPDLIYDQLIGMGCADRLVFSWGGNPGVGSLHRLRDAVENGWPRPLAIEEHSHAAMACALYVRAGTRVASALTLIAATVKPARSCRDAAMEPVPLPALARLAHSLAHLLQPRLGLATADARLGRETLQPRGLHASRCWSHSRQRSVATRGV